VGFPQDMIGNDVAELFLELGQQFLDCEVQNEEGLTVKTGTGNGDFQKKKISKTPLFPGFCPGQFLTSPI